MFVKSRKSSVFMACSFVIPAVVIAFAAGEVRYLMMPEAERSPSVAYGFAGVGAVMIALAILLLSIGLASLVIYRLNESHYGRQGPIRWAIAGLIYGFLQQVVLRPIPPDFDFTLSSVLKQIGGDLAWKVLTLVLSYLVVFSLFSFFQNTRLTAHRE